MTSDSITLTIKKWRVFNPKSDYLRHPHWFKINNNIINSQSLFGLTAEQKWLWICILSECSRKNSETISIRFSYLAAASGIPKNVVLETLEMFKENDLLSVDCQLTVSLLSVTPPVSVSRLTRDKRRRDKRREEKKERSIGEENFETQGTFPQSYPQDQTIEKTTGDLKAGLSDTAEFIGVYVKAFQKRYGKNSRPDLGGKVQGQIKGFVTEYGLDRSSMMIQVYLQMDDPWFLTKCYDFSTFLENRQKIGIALDTGKKDPSRKNHQSLAEYRAEQAQKLKELNQ